MGLIVGDFTRMEGGTNLLRGCVFRTFFAIGCHSVVR